jgi:hypothetical protein
MPKDFETRRQEFLSQYGKLREEFQCDFVSVPGFIPTERGVWEIAIQPQVFEIFAGDFVPLNFGLCEVGAMVVAR